MSSWLHTVMAVSQNIPRSAAQGFWYAATTCIHAEVLRRAQRTATSVAKRGGSLLCFPQEIERKIEEGKAEGEALEAQHFQVQRECEAVEQQCEEHKQAQEQDKADIVKLNEQRCQVKELYTCRATMPHEACPLCCL